jgi:WD40 repeat protein
LRALKGHNITFGTDFVVSEPAFTPDSKTLVSAGGDGMIRLWDVRSGKEIRAIAEDDVAGIALSPNGAVMASRARKRVKTGPGSNWSYWATDIKLWNMQSGKETSCIAIRPLKKNNGVEYGPWFLAFSPDGRDLITTASDGGMRVWDVATGKERRRFADGTSITAVAFSPDGQLACIEGHSIRLRDYLTGRDLIPSAGHRREIETAAPSPDGRTVAIPNDDEQCIILWDAQTGREKRRVSAANESIHSLLFARDGRSLLAITKEKSLWTWDITGERVPRRVKCSRSGTLRSSLDGKILAIGERDKICLFDPTDGKELRTLEGTGPSRAGFDFTPDGRAILAWTGDGKLHRWDTLTGAHTAKDFYRLGSWPCSTGFSPDGRFITFGVQNSDFLPVVDLATGKEVCRFDLGPQEGSQTLAWVAFAPDSRSLAWGGRKDGNGWLGELATGAVRQQLAGHSGRVRSLAFSADGRTLVTGSADTTTLVWKLTGRLPSDDARTDMLTEADLAASWNGLREKIGTRAYTALRRLTADPARSVAFLNERLNPIAAADARRVAALIVNLEDGNFAKREQATRELERIAEPALGAIANKLREKPALETARRLERLIGQIEMPTPERLQAIRAVEVLELIGTSEARKLLARLAQGFPNARLTREASESLSRLESLPTRR